MEQYAKIYPKAPEIIFNAFERQNKHRIDLENQATAANIKNESRGQWFGFTIAFMTILGGFVLIKSDKDIQGITSIIAPAKGITAGPSFRQ